ncbi:hemagglutinin repeat-containing protein, partial [Propionispora vibrioides]
SSNITAGNNVNITAKADDVTLQDTKINAKNVKIDAERDINLTSAQNVEQTDSKSDSSSWSLGVSLNGGVFGNASKGNSNGNGTVVTHSGTEINATDTVDLHSDRDTNIIDSQVKGKEVIANVGRDLNIASQQDIDNYTEKSSSSGIGFSTGPSGGVTGSVSKGKINSEYSSVTEQAGIYAGEGGFDITVGKNTDLKGAVIEAPAGKNKLSTDTLTYSDIENHADYSASSVGVNLDTRKNAKYNEYGITPDIGVSAKGDASSTTKSAISPGTIEVRSNPDQDLSGLSRSTDQTLNSLGKIFDKKSVQEKQELAKLFGELAYEEVHKISDRAKDAAKNELKKAKEDKNSTPEQLAALQAKVDSWDVGGANKIALHAFVGAVMADIGGGNALSGAVGAGLNEAVQKELAEKFKDNPDLHQWASAIIGSAAAAVIGGDAQSGASTAVSGTKNNALNTTQQERFADRLNQAINSGSSIEIVLVIADYALLDSAQNLVWNDTGAEQQTIDAFNAAARALGITDYFAYNENGNLHDNFVAFKDALIANVQTVDSSTLIAAGAVATVTIAGVVLFKYRGSLVRAGAGAGGAWSQATFQSDQLLQRHLADHAATEWGEALTATQYIQKARSLLNSNVGGEIEGFTNSLGWTFRYNTATNEFAIGSPQGTISTLMRPADGMNYWLEQVAKYKW